MKPEQRIKSIITWLTFFGTSIATVFALLASWNWFAELFSHFRLYYLLSQGLLILTFLHGRRHALLLITLVLAAPNAWYVAPYLAPLLLQTQSASASGGTTIVALNLQYDNDNHASARSYIASRDPDILLLQEYTPRWHAELASLVHDYPHRIVSPQPGVFGMALYSKLPLDNPRRLNLGAPGAINLAATLMLPHAPLQFYGLHLYPPTSPSRARQRNEQLRQLRAELSSGGERRLIAGDLNLTPFSPHFVELLAATGLRDARKPFGLHITWPASSVPLWIPIDHCLADEELPVSSVSRGPAFGSDHYPLEITIAPVN